MECSRGIAAHYQAPPGRTGLRCSAIPTAHPKKSKIVPEPRLHSQAPSKFPMQAVLASRSRTEDPHGSVLPSRRQTSLSREVGPHLEFPRATSASIAKRRVHHRDLQPGYLRATCTPTVEPWPSWPAQHIDALLRRRHRPRRLYAIHQTRA